MPRSHTIFIYSIDPRFSKCAEESDVTSADCRDLKICVESGSDEKFVLKLFSDRFIVSFTTPSDGSQNFASNECNVYAGGIGEPDLKELRNLGYQGDFRFGEKLFTREPQAIVTRDDDPQWYRFVNWIVIAAFFAEENGITLANAQEMPEINLFGESLSRMFQHAIAMAGNIAEVFERNFGNQGGKQNELNQNLSGPQHYPLSGIFID